MKIKDILKEMDAGSVAAVSMPIGNIQKRIPKNGLDSNNLMGGPKAKKKKTKNKKA